MRKTPEKNSCVQRGAHQRDYATAVSCACPRVDELNGALELLRLIFQGQACLKNAILAAAGTSGGVLEAFSSMAAVPLTLWGSKTSRAFRIHWALHELGLPYEKHLISARGGGTSSLFLSSDTERVLCQERAACRALPLYWYSRATVLHVQARPPPSFWRCRRLGLCRCWSTARAPERVQRRSQRWW
jgi:hypothetical protein